MKYFVFAILCLSAVSAQYHGSTGHSSGSNGRHQQSSSSHMSGGYQSSRGGMSGGHHRSGRSLVSQAYSGIGSGHVESRPALVSSGSYGHSGHRMGRSVGETSIGPVPVPAVQVYGGRANGGHAGHRRGRSVPLMPVVGYSGQVAGGHYEAQRIAPRVVAPAPMVVHGHRMARSLVGAYGGAVVGHSSGYYGGTYSNAGYQRSSMGVLHS